MTGILFEMSGLRPVESVQGSPEPEWKESTMYLLYITTADRGGGEKGSLTRKTVFMLCSKKCNRVDNIIRRTSIG